MVIYERTGELGGGTSLLGYLGDLGAGHLTVDMIEKAFPNGYSPCDDKVDYEWRFKSGNNIFTVYNYKFNPGRTMGYNWHVGGFPGSDWWVFARWFINQVTDAQ